MRRDVPIADLAPELLEVLEGIAGGRPVTRIAAELGISRVAAYTRFGELRCRLGIRSHVGMALYALRQGLIDPHGQPAGFPKCISQRRNPSPDIAIGDDASG
jgi:hypothetical protein